MRSRWILGLVLALGLLLAAPADAARFTTRLDALAAILDTRAADPTVTGKLKKAVTKSVKKLAKDTTSLAAEVKTALKVIGSLEKAAAADAEIQAAATAAVQGLLADVAAAVNAAQAEVDAARAKGKIQFDKLDKKLQSARDYVIQFPMTTGLKSRLLLLFKSIVKVVQVTKTLASGGGGGGGGGGGNVCGPEVKPAGIRSLRAGESVSGSVTEFGMDPYTFAADSVWAKAGSRFPGSTVILDVIAYDCDRRAAWKFALPYPPQTGVDYFNGSTLGVEAGYQADWDGFTQVFPGINSVKIRVDSFDAASKTISGHVTIPGIVPDLAFTLTDWQGD